MFAFRPLTLADLPRVHRWFHAPHAKRWFGHALEDVERDYGASVRGEECFTSFVVSCEGSEIGLVNFGLFGDYPEMMRAYEVVDPNAANCDVIIGEEARAHRGLGPAMIRAFLDQIVFRDPRVTTIVIDPVPDNAIAIRAYEKAGFRFSRALPEDGEGNALYLMVRGRAEPDPEPFTVRPARPGELSIAIDLDDDSSELYREVGLPFDFGPDHPFARLERDRFAESLRQGRLLFACEAGTPVGMVVLGHVDGRPHVEQLSVRRSHGRRGIGRALLLRALRWAVCAGELWLSTYAHVAWSAPFYARMGFEVVKDPPAELAALIAAAKTAVPDPEQQIAMVCRGARFAQHMRA